MDFSIADCADISELVRMRIDYIKANQGNVSIENELAMRNNLPIYFEKHMGKDLFIFVAKEDNQIIYYSLFTYCRKAIKSAFYERTNRRSPKCIYNAGF